MVENHRSELSGFPGRWYMPRPGAYVARLCTGIQGTRPSAAAAGATSAATGATGTPTAAAAAKPRSTAESSPAAKIMRARTCQSGAPQAPSGSAHPRHLAEAHACCSPAQVQWCTGDTCARHQSCSNSSTCAGCDACNSGSSSLCYALGPHRSSPQPAAVHLVCLRSWRGPGQQLQQQRWRRLCRAQPQQCQ